MPKKIFSNKAAWVFAPQRNGQRVFAFLLMAFALLPGDVYAKKSSPLILKRADYNENRMTGGKLVSVLRGDVVFQYEDATIKSQYAKWFRRDGIARFSDNVSIIQPGQLLSCDRLDFDRDRKRLIARGNVDFYDSTEQTRIQARSVIYYLDTKNLELDQAPKLVRYDTLSNDTLVITSRKMRYNDSLNMATAHDEVTIEKGKLTARSKVAYYYTESDEARLRVSPDIYYGIHRIVGDSVDLFFEEQKLQGLTVVGNAHAVHKDDNREDTVITTVDGDSLYMAITQEGNLDSIWVHGNTKSRYFLASDTAKVNEALGKRMIIAFGKEGQARDLTIAGNAQSVYYVDDESDSGRNEATGDKIFVTFHEGKAIYLRLIGGVRGNYFARSGK
jgi:lipopolysaccharide export system protein LptA